MQNKLLHDEAHKLAHKITNSAAEGNYFTAPFKHAVIDNAISENLINAMNDSFPSLDDDCWEHTKTPGIEMKSRTTWTSEFDIPDALSFGVRILNSAPILRAMSEMLEIPKLMPDPYFTGGGLNVTEAGGLLDVHVDGNYHDASGMNRRVNALLYLNEIWQPEWGGQFGLYSDDGQTLYKSIDPTFNRLVIFDTHDKSFHGLPNPIVCPPNIVRKSVLLYYYTVAERPSDQNSHADPHSALWRSKGFTDKNGKVRRKFT